MKFFGDATKCLTMKQPSNLDQGLVDCEKLELQYVGGFGTPSHALAVKLSRGGWQDVTLSEMAKYKLDDELETPCKHASYNLYGIPPSSKFLVVLIIVGLTKTPSE